MLKATEQFIKDNIELIEENKWDEVYEHSIETSELLVYIDFLKTMLTAGINPNLDKYTLNDLEADLSVISGMHAEDFTASKIEGVNVLAYLNNKAIAQALTNVLRATRRLNFNEQITGDGTYMSNLYIIIPEIYDVHSVYDRMRALDNAVLEVHVSAGGYLDELYYEEGPYQFTEAIVGDGLKDFVIAQDNTYEDNINQFLDGWIEAFFTED